jgi:hypothetical protein
MKYFASMTTHALPSNYPASMRFFNTLTGGATPEFLSILQGWTILFLLLTLLFMIGLRASHWLGPLLFSPPPVAETPETVMLHQ